MLLSSILQANPLNFSVFFVQLLRKKDQFKFFSELLAWSRFESFETQINIYF